VTAEDAELAREIAVAVHERIVNEMLYAIGLWVIAKGKIVERSGIGKTGWYRTPNVHALPDTMMKKVTQVLSGKSGQAELFIPAKWRKAANATMSVPVCTRFAQWRHDGRQDGRWLPSAAQPVAREKPVFSVTYRD